MASPHVQTPSRGISSPQAIEDKQFALLSAIMIVAAFILGFVPDSFDWQGSLVPSDYSSGSVIRRLIWFPFFLFAGILVLMRWTLFTVYIRHVNPFLLAVTLYFFLTIGWSEFPAKSLRKAIQWLGLLIICSVLFLYSWHPKRFERVFRSGYLIALIGSYLFVFLIPEYGRHLGGLIDKDHPGAWRGMSSHKNGTGQMLTLGAILWTHALLTRAVPVWQALTVLFLTAIFLVMARSSTAILGAIICCSALVVWIRNPGWLDLPKVVLYLCIGFAAFILFFTLFVDLPTIDAVLGPIAKAFGKDLTFSSRTGIWELSIEAWRERPIFGWGFGGFWLGIGHDSPSLPLTNKLGFVVGQAHNGYIDSLVDLGVVGASLLWLFMLYHAIMVIRFAKYDRNSAALLGSITLYILLLNLTETNITGTIDKVTIINICGSLYISRVMLQQKFGLLQDAELPVSASTADHKHRSRNIKIRQTHV